MWCFQQHGFTNFFIFAREVEWFLPNEKTNRAQPLPSEKEAFGVRQNSTEKVQEATKELRHKIYLFQLAALVLI